MLRIKTSGESLIEMPAPMLTQEIFDQFLKEIKELRMSWKMQSIEVQKMYGFLDHDQMTKYSKFHNRNKNKYSEKLNQIIKLIGSNKDDSAGSVIKSFIKEEEEFLKDKDLTRKIKNLEILCLFYQCHHYRISIIKTLKILATILSMAETGPYLKMLHNIEIYGCRAIEKDFQFIK